MLKNESDGSVFLHSIKGKTYNAFLICVMFLFTLFNFLLGWSNLQCTIDESIKGAASQRYGITFDGNINIKYNIPPVTYVFFIKMYISPKGITTKAFYTCCLTYKWENINNYYNIVFDFKSRVKCTPLTIVESFNVL